MSAFDLRARPRTVPYYTRPPKMGFPLPHLLSKMLSQNASTDYQVAALLLSAPPSIWNIQLTFLASKRPHIRGTAYAVWRRPLDRGVAVLPVQKVADRVAGSWVERKYVQACVGTKALPPLPHPLYPLLFARLKTCLRTHVCPPAVPIGPPEA